MISHLVVKYSHTRAQGRDLQMRSDGPATASISSALCTLEKVPALSRQLGKDSPSSGWRQPRLRAWKQGLAGFQPCVCLSGGRPLQGATCTLICCDSASWVVGFWQRGLPFSLALLPYLVVSALKVHPHALSQGR